MSKLNRIAMALLLAQPLVVGAGAAFAFSMVNRDAAAGPGASDAQIDNLSDQFARGWITTPVDYESLLRPEWVPEGSTDATPVSLSPTMPVKEQ